MKRSVLLLILLLLVFPSAQAETQEEFDRGCRQKTAFAVPVFDFTQDEEIMYIQCGGTPPELLAADHISAGTYVHLEASGANGWKHILYMRSGVLRRGWAQVTLIDCTALVLMGDGIVHEVHENDPDYARMLAEGTPEALPTPLPDAEPAPVDALPAQEPAADGEVLGRAYIYAPKTGKASLRGGPSDDYIALESCPAGMVVQLLAGDAPGFVRVDTGSAKGYVRAGCLRSLDENGPMLGVGVLICDGDAAGGAAVNIRNDADKGSVRIAQWPTGTRVSVYGRNDRWCEIEARGMHGFVQTEYLSLEP